MGVQTLGEALCPAQQRNFTFLQLAVFRIHMFLDLRDPDPLIRGMDPDPSIIKQK